MSDADTPQPIPFLPCVEPNDQAAPAVLGAAFDYIGEALTLAEFVAYVQTYNFGSVPFDQVVIHNTANPDASWAPLGTSSTTWWDRDETRLSVEQVKAKRLRQLSGIRDYYVSLGWSSGPHLFVDDRWIYLFTSMYSVGTHAKEGNSYHDANGQLHYSLGVEVVGWYGRVGWPLSVQAQLRGAIQALQTRLKTFQIAYTAAPLHRPAAHQGSIAFHRDYNKPECPGAIITPAYAIPILAASATPPPPPPGAGIYSVRYSQAVFESPSPDGKIALNNTAVLQIGQRIDVDEVGHGGWAHLRSGLGFVPVGVLTRIA